MKNALREIKIINRIVYDSSKTIYLLVVMHRILEGLIPSFQVVLVTNIVELVTQIVKKEKQYEAIYGASVVFILLTAFIWMEKKTIIILRQKLMMRMKEKFRVRLIEHVTDMEYHYIEDEKSRNLIERVTTNCEEKVVSGFDSFLNIVAIIIRICGLSIIIMTQQFLIGIIVLVLNIPGIYLAKKNGDITYQANINITEYSRKNKYLQDVIIDTDFQQERLVFNNLEYFNKSWCQQFDISRKLEMKAFLNYFMKMRFSTVVQVIVIIIMMIFLSIPVSKGEMTSAYYMVITGNLIALHQIVTQQLSYTMKEFVHAVEYVKDYEEFIRFEKVDKTSFTPSDIDKQKIQIEFKNVWFKYPNTEQYILKGLNLVIHSKKSYAFVGENGAGKTTIIKLMLGMYREFEGEILINGMPIQAFSLRCLQNIFSVVFQDFAKYPISIKDNIVLGEQSLCNNDINLDELLHSVKLYEDVAKLKNKENTLLTKLTEDGIDLSLGQWQKLAIARALAKKCPIKILDEPTASVDPICECEFYNMFQNLSKENTTILISHRLASVKYVDKILVFNHGVISEEGTHEELMRKDMLYAAMYRSQRSWYDEK